jgi:hypothetical protein
LAATDLAIRSFGQLPAYTSGWATTSGRSTLVLPGVNRDARGTSQTRSSPED